MPDSRQAPIWELDELSHAGHEHLDPTYVAGYDQKAQTDWSEDVAELQALGIGASSTVVDLGAGTGTFAEAIAPHVQRVIAVDVSEAMVARMRERGIEAVQAGFLTYEHKGDPADAVMTRNALHHLPDFWKSACSVTDRSDAPAWRSPALAGPLLLFRPWRSEVCHPEMDRFRSDRPYPWLDISSARRTRSDGTLNFHLVA